jgi:phosphotransferase system IIA component
MACFVGKMVFTVPSNGATILPSAGDQVFAQKMMGDGVGFIPADGKIVAPFDGTVKTIFYHLFLQNFQNLPHST